MKVRHNLKQIEKSAKPLDAWWTVMVIDPLAFRITWFFVNFTSFTPNHVSLMALIFGLLASIFYLQGTHSALVVGAVLFEIAFVLDCTDGKIARVNNSGTKFGAYWDFIQDRILQFIALFTIVLGQFQLIGNTDIIFAGLIYLFADAIHRTNSLHSGSLRFQYGDKAFVRSSPEQVKVDLDEYIKTHSKWKGDLKRWFISRRIKLLPTTIEMRVLVFFVAAIFNQVYLGLILASFALFLLTILRGVLTIKQLYLLPEKS